MDTLVLILIVLGALIMVSNIYRYSLFLKSSQDVLSSGKKRDTFWKRLALVLLIFFLLGYLSV